MSYEHLEKAGFDIEAFQKRLTHYMNEAGMNAAQLSRRAGLNARAVTDIQQGRIKSPRVQTVMALEAALGVNPGTLLGFAPATVSTELQALLHELDEATQQQLLATLRSLRKT
ncbi:transcriptional regulator with XRE-family HTH domain [Roseovarius sp. MBR-154]|jgi:transcriptional regulator with XRE-family HTH domain